MKKLVFLFFIILLGFASIAQKHKNTRSKDLTITQNKTVASKGIQFVLREVMTDSRCPQGVDCVWAGEAKADVSVYKNGKWIEEETITFSSKSEAESIGWFAKQLAIQPSKIKSISLLPYPKNGQKIDPKTYSILVSINK